MKGRPVILLAGGTGGHIFPAIATAHALRARGVPVRWIGSAGGMETRLVPPHGIDIDTIDVRGIRGKGVGTLLRAPFTLAASVRAARRLIRRHAPRAVISFGGFAAGPGGLAARLCGVPLLVHEQNRAPGMTNRVLARFAARVLTGFPGTFAREEAVGNPVRDEIAMLPPPAERFAGREGPLRLLVLGGSQGARALNAAVPQALAVLRLTHAVEVRHQCGEKLLAEAERAYRDAGVAAAVEPFIADMAEAYAWADLVVCRAGALTLAELCAAGVGSLLVPFPQAVDDHQTRNAEYLVEHGAARLLPQGGDLAERLVREIGECAARGTLLRMADAARALARPDAAERVARIVIETSETAA
ncbi:undecaprenyldiphospho-muramoylpentapeptide beta-N-acetylglucosaminyltransferase [Vulcaniibacterium thermophilum]|uniref:UDP-N-acetylglucosamine--N-acetylmuramyl-(pentapeptide) pyrophosphoryl-undecaprenol N-acetylglucosamine transferase n=1 Tax=Vulcaniibacterium thermophilum TaxID=1169913 RepID=A0A919DAW7_9GAMM|nr:undecaprenyldiphospho-muramoylpentapeptide beta-N-acetylglucosaminyltransferase [Vulcaniibacterium thermophilum]GHE33242.1 UDP-N-acetylglucosamine--N-acetylmuramyl-(pentapeptide) pyrophosphoryl-undecaprenol N-acetylglucosamine transferase [Vulcaniibacterium thermophilum]